MTKHFILFVFLSIFSTSCGEEEQQDIDPLTTIKPPEWILGEWQHESFASTGYEFKTYNLCEMSLDNPLCYSIFLQTGQLEITEQSYTDNFYKITFHNIMGPLEGDTDEFTAFEFLRIDDNTIKYDHHLYYKMH
jgi:hypothetical protein